MEKRVSGRTALRAHGEAVCTGEQGDNKVPEAQGPPQSITQDLELWPFDKLVFAYDISSEKSGEIQKAIEEAAELGLTTRTNSDSSEFKKQPTLTLQSAQCWN